MNAMKKLFGIVMLMMLSISVSAEEQSKVTVVIGTFEGGTITENLENSQKKNEADGTYKIVITVTPAEGFIITKNDIVVMATIPAKTRTNSPELAEKLTLTGDDPEDPSEQRNYSVTVQEGFGVWVKEANFHTSSLVIGSDTKVIEEGKLAGVTTITIKNEKQVVSLGNNVVTGKTTVIVPGNLYNEYKTTEGWKEATITVDEKESTKMDGVSFTENNNYSAFFSKDPLKVPSVLHAYMITGLDNDGNLVLTEVEGVIPGGTAVLLYSEKIDGNDFRTVVSTEDGQAVGGKNPLQVVTEAGKKVEVGEVYMLYNDVFYYTQAGTIPQNGIYLDPNVLNDNGQHKSRARLLIGGTGNTTGISDVITNDKARTNSEVWYTLDGRQLNGTPGQKGIYIRNGKKMVVTK